MEMVQRDITQSMRGILVDWLVEVWLNYLSNIISKLLEVYDTNN